MCSSTPFLSTQTNLKCTIPFLPWRLFLGDLLDCFPKRLDATRTLFQIFPVRYNKRKCRVAKRWAIAWLAFIDSEGSKSKHMLFFRNITFVAIYALLRVNICDQSLESNAFESITHTIIFWMVFFVWKALNDLDCALYSYGHWSSIAVHFKIC